MFGRGGTYTKNDVDNCRIAVAMTSSVLRKRGVAFITVIGIFSRNSIICNPEYIVARRLPSKVTWLRFRAYFLYSRRETSAIFTGRGKVATADQHTTRVHDGQTTKRRLKADGYRGVAVSRDKSRSPPVTLLSALLRPGGLRLHQKCYFYIRPSTYRFSHQNVEKGSIFVSAKSS